MIINNIHDDSDAFRVDGVDKLAEFCNPRGGVGGVGCVGAFGDVVVDGIVAPVVLRTEGQVAGFVH